MESNQKNSENCIKVKGKIYDYVVDKPGRRSNCVENCDMRDLCEGKLGTDSYICNLFQEDSKENGYMKLRIEE